MLLLPSSVFVVIDNVGEVVDVLEVVIDVVVVAVVVAVVVVVVVAVVVVVVVKSDVDGVDIKGTKDKVVCLILDTHSLSLKIWSF